MKKIMKIFLKDLIILLICAIAIFGVINYSAKNTQAQTQTHYSSFSDVVNDHWAFWYIEAVAQAEIIDECFGDQTIFCPSGDLSRELMAIFIARTVGLSPIYPSTPTFVDVPKDYPNYGYIEAVYRAGYMKGMTKYSEYCSGTDCYFLPLKSMFGPYIAPDREEWVGDESRTLVIIQRVLGRSPEIPPNFNMFDHPYDTTLTDRAQLAALLAWNFNLSPNISGTIYKTVLDENNQPIYGDDILSGAIVKVWNNASTTNPDIIVRSDENGNYSVNLNIKQVTNNVKIQSYDPDKNFPPMTIGQQIAYDKALFKKAYAGILSSTWDLFHKKKSDCSSNLYSRIVQISNQENLRWLNYHDELDRKHPDWTDEQVDAEVNFKMWETYVGSHGYCCTGFVTWVLTKAGLVDKNNRSFFYTTRTTLPSSDARIVGASTLRQWFASNNDKELVARDGNIYRIKLSPKVYLLQDLSKLQEGQVFLKLAPQGAGYTGHSAIFYPLVDRENKISNTMNCDGPNQFISTEERDLQDALFYGAGRFECVNTSSSTIKRIFRKKGR